MHVLLHFLRIAVGQIRNIVEFGEGLAFEAEAAGEHIIARLLDGTRANDDRGDGRLFEYPAQGDLCGRAADLFGDLEDGLQTLVGVGGEITLRIGPGVSGARAFDRSFAGFVFPGEKTACRSLQ